MKSQIDLYEETIELMQEAESTLMKEHEAEETLSEDISNEITEFESAIDNLTDEIDNYQDAISKEEKKIAVYEKLISTWEGLIKEKNDSIAEISETYDISTTLSTPNKSTIISDFIDMGNKIYEIHISKESDSATSVIGENGDIYLDEASSQSLYNSIVDTIGDSTAIITEYTPNYTADIIIVIASTEIAIEIYLSRTGIGIKKTEDSESIYTESVIVDTSSIYDEISKLS